MQISPPDLEEFVTQHSNILMIHAGHFHAEWLRLDGVNRRAQTIIQILTDYQSTRNGGDGWLRIYELDFDENTFSFDIYSPTLDRKRTTIDHYVETIFLAYDQRAQIMEVLGATEEAYFQILDLFLKNRPAPDGFLLQHPDFDEPEERAYYEQYLSELFLGSPPAGFDDILEWEGLWLEGFAINDNDPFDFRDWVRSPRGTMAVDYTAYVPEPPAPRSTVAAFAALWALGWLRRRFPSEAPLAAAHTAEIQRRRMRQQGYFFCWSERM